MTHRQYLALVVLAVLMAATAFGLGSWSENLNPDGIVPHTPVAQSDSAEPRSAFTFGASMGLLAAGLLYCVIAAGLLLQRRAKGLPASRFIYSVVGLAVTGFALSYLIDDYFY